MAELIDEKRAKLPTGGSPFVLPEPVEVGRQIVGLGRVAAELGDEYLFRAAESAPQEYTVPATEAFTSASSSVAQTASALGTVGQRLSATCIDEALQAACHLHDGVRALRDTASEALLASARSQRAALGEPHPQLPGVTMLDEDVRHHAEGLSTTANSLADGQAVLPQSFDSAYGNGNGRQVSVPALAEAAKQVEWPLREALNEASFHALSSHQDAATVFLARTWTSAATDLARANLGFARAADLTASLADAQMRAPGTALAVEEQVRTEVDLLLSDANAAVDRAIVTMRSNVNALTSEHPLPAPATAEELASAVGVQQDLQASRRAAALTRSTTAPAASPDPQHPSPAAPGPAPSSARGRR
ncbi:hypothetical protein [Kitasatospora cineracea]|uniref:hypothetical protein n=1 Tax=Kitasatospora cineracea TaxID=88074 RepID=UPI00380DBAD9